jgi:hypothetical protein
LRERACLLRDTPLAALHLCTLAPPRSLEMDHRVTHMTDDDVADALSGPHDHIEASVAWPG